MCWFEFITFKTLVVLFPFFVLSIMCWHLKKEKKRMKSFMGKCLRDKNKAGVIILSSLLDQG